MDLFLVYDLMKVSFLTTSYIHFFSPFSFFHVEKFTKVLESFNKFQTRIQKGIVCCKSLVSKKNLKITKFFGYMKLQYVAQKKE
jgi:hypothetical protein